jgi:hypothetical protein
MCSARENRNAPHCRVGKQELRRPLNGNQKIRAERCMLPRRDEGGMNASCESGENLFNERACRPGENRDPVTFRFGGTTLDLADKPDPFSRREAVLREIPASPIAGMKISSIFPQCRFLHGSRNKATHNVTPAAMANPILGRTGTVSRRRKMDECRILFLSAARRKKEESELRYFSQTGSSVTRLPRNSAKVIDLDEARATAKPRPDD